MIRRPPKSPLFPYPTLFRSLNPPPGCHFHPRCPHAMPRCAVEAPPTLEIAPGHHSARSEEHTSELQSQSNLVCRLLLEKKKKKSTLLHRISCMLNTSYRRRC